MSNSFVSGSIGDAEGKENSCYVKGQNKKERVMPDTKPGSKTESFYCLLN